MINRTRLRYHFGALFVGIMAAAVIAYVIAIFSHTIAVLVFFVLSGLWVLMDISAAKHADRARGGRLGVFPDARQWTPHRLPLEFRFITRDTTIDEVIEKIGPGTPKVGDPSDVVRYDSPNGQIIFIYPEFSRTRSGRVSAIQLFEHASHLPTPL